MKPLSVYVRDCEYLSLDGSRLVIDFDLLCREAGIPSTPPNHLVILRKLLDTFAELLDAVVVTLPFASSKERQVSR